MNTLNILCVYNDQYDREPEWETPNPSKVLTGHNVTMVHTFLGAMRLLNRTFDKGLPFDVMISDCYIPAKKGGVLTNHTYILIEHAAACAVKATGIFLPADYPKSFLFDRAHQPNILLASNACWTETCERDWARMLRVLRFRLQRSGMM